jgi:hypothetical protein
MTKILFTIILIISAITLFAQKVNSTDRNSYFIKPKNLLGKWHAEGDSNAIFFFTRAICYSLYEKDTIFKKNYSFSNSCNLKDTVSVNQSYSYILMWEADSVDFCNEILGLNEKTLSLMDNSNGHIYIFNKGNSLKNSKKGTNTKSKNKTDFKQDRPFKILSSTRSITKQSSAKDTNMCNDWAIPRRYLYKIIRDSKRIGGTEWDLSFEVLPCIIKGQLKQNENLFDFEINGGSWMYIKSSDTTMILGNFKKEDEKYFIEGHNPD